jgi:adenylate kinase family enzyme
MIKRIAIIGNAGSGKSTLAEQLHQVLGLPVYHLDKYFWKPHWTRTDPAEYKLVHDRLCDQDVWIIDGMNRRLLEYRVKRADVVIFLDTPRYICLWRVLNRAIRYYGKETPSSAEKCPERINWKFLKFLIWIWNFKDHYRPKIMALLRDHASKKRMYILRTQKEMDQYLAEVAKAFE